MTVVAKIKGFLESNNIDFEVLEHELAFTAMEIAKAQHLPGHQMVKSVIMDAEGKFILCVLPSTHHIDFDKLRKILKVENLKLADEVKVGALFPEFEIGAMPPFGQLAEINVYLDANLEENELIAFNAGTHRDVLRIKLKDYLRAVSPHIADFSKRI